MRERLQTPPEKYPGRRHGSCLEGENWDATESLRELGVRGSAGGGMMVLSRKVL